MREPLVPRAPDRAITSLARRELGFVPGILDFVGGCPWLARAEIAFYSSRPRHLSPRLCELVPYAVALDRGCRHVSGALAAFLRFAGYEDADLRAIETRALDRFASSEALAIEYAIAVARGQGAAMRPRLAPAGFDARGTAELAGLAVLIVFGSHVATGLGVPPDGLEAFERSFIGKMLRPLIRRQIHAARSWGADRPIDDDHGAVFADVIGLLAGSPLHTLARDVIADAWRSPVVPGADKAALVAAIAETLGATELASTANTLASSSSPRAARLRDYGAATATADADGIYAATRALAGSLGRLELLEATGVAALANGFTRLSLVYTTR